MLRYHCLNLLKIKLTFRSQPFVKVNGKLFILHIKLNVPINCTNLNNLLMITIFSYNSPNSQSTYYVLCNIELIDLSINILFYFKSTLIICSCCSSSELLLYACRSSFWSKLRTRFISLIMPSFLGRIRLASSYSPSALSNNPRLANAANCKWDQRLLKVELIYSKYYFYVLV